MPISLTNLETRRIMDSQRIGFELSQNGTERATKRLARPVIFNALRTFDSFVVPVNASLVFPKTPI